MRKVSREERKKAVNVDIILLFYFQEIKALFMLQFPKKLNIIKNVYDFMQIIKETTKKYVWNSWIYRQ